MNEQDKFLGDVQELSIVDQPITPEQPVSTETKPEESAVESDEVSEDIKNRRHKRLEAKLQAEREANIALNERLKVIAETKKSQETQPTEYLKNVERIYGTDSPEAQQATELLKSALKSAKEEAVESALEKFREEQRLAKEEEKAQEKKLNSFIEQIEDEYNVFFTPDLEKSYFRLMEKLSPKDSDGNVIAYADPVAVWETLSEKLPKKDTRAKDIASRSMTQSGAQAQGNLQDDSQVRFLKEIGIL